MTTNSPSYPIDPFSPLNLERVREALTPVVRPVYGPPHVYSACLPRYESAAGRERPRAKHDQLRLYIHIPFCNYSCSFCFYAKRVGVGETDMERYVSAVLRELEWAPAGTPLSQLFVGGGTPTALPPEQLDRLLGSVFDRVASVPDKVHTVETSPESISDRHLDVLSRRGIGRLSMGIQSLDDAVLDGVQRRHGRAESEAACRRIIDAGFILNIDLIYGLPGQTEESFRRDMEAVAEFGVHAVTLYDLRTNVRTPVVRSLAEQERIDLARLIRWRKVIKESARDFGYTQTRWHTFKRLDGPAARHEREDTFTPDAHGYQLGLGQSARSHLGYTIYRNHDRMNTYMERVESGQSPVEGVMHLDDQARRTLYIARSLGDGKPLSRSVWRQAFGSELDEEHGAAIRNLVGAELLREEGDTLIFTEPGKLIYDLVTLAFYSEADRLWLQEQDRAAQERYRPQDTSREITA